MLRQEMDHQVVSLELLMLPKMVIKENSLIIKIFPIKFEIDINKKPFIKFYLKNTYYIHVVSIIIIDL